MFWIVFMLICTTVGLAVWVEASYGEHVTCLESERSRIRLDRLCRELGDHCEVCNRRLDHCPHGNEDICPACNQRLNRCEHGSSIRRDHIRPTCHDCGDRHRPFWSGGRLDWNDEAKVWKCASCDVGIDKRRPPHNPFPVGGTSFDTI